MTPPPLGRPARLGVLASGGGSNLQAILDYFDGPGAGIAEVAWVGSDRVLAGALGRARARDIPADHVDHGSADAIGGRLATYGVQLLVLAGYLKFIPDVLTRAWRGRIVNVHPALLPSFGGHGMYGMRVHAAVLAAGVRVSGATVHFVDDAYDRGPIIAQWPVPVLPADTPETLGTRVLMAEHQLYPRAIAAVALGHARLGDDNRTVLVQPGTQADQPFALAGLPTAPSIDLLLPDTP
ncbi:MAG: phosphoribosylglycinamide formyltransferase [Gemmatimonadetes bacterium]|nr:phosphoribosylglycinamide formyltransferase [Gemmatimonadota bacterium]